MGSAIFPRIMLAGGDGAANERIQQLLEQAGCTVDCRSLEKSHLGNGTLYQAVLVDANQESDSVLEFCQWFRKRQGESFVPILLLADMKDSQSWVDCGVDACISKSLEPEKLVAQVQAFLRIKGHFDRLAEKNSYGQRLNRKLHSAHQRVDQELELARRIQLSFLPRTLPEVPGLRLGVYHRPSGQVGGDFYDVFRLDENHLGLYVADAMGHGVPAGLLTLFVNKEIRPKEVFGRQYSLVSPSDVLQHLNDQLIGLKLAENAFLTMTYIQVNFREGILNFSRAGHPYPLFVPADGAPERLMLDGSLLGVAKADFQVQTRRLRPGDKVLLHTDGVDSTSWVGSQKGTQNLLDCASRHRSLPIQEFIDQISGELFQEGCSDDFTILGLEMV